MTINAPHPLSTKENRHLKLITDKLERTIQNIRAPQALSVTWVLAKIITNPNG